MEKETIDGPLEIVIMVIITMINHMVLEFIVQSMGIITLVNLQMDYFKVRRWWVLKHVSRV